MREKIYKYCCDICDIKTGNKFDFNKHVATSKHLNTIKYNNLALKIANYKCDCGKIYPYLASLYNHKKKCNNKAIENITIKNEASENEASENEEPEDITINDEASNYITINDEASENIMIKDETSINYKELIMKLINENEKLHNILIEQHQQAQEQHKQMYQQMNEIIPKIGNNITTNVTQKFSINVFLNERCKDAITMDEFVDKIAISMKNLSYTKDNGLTAGLTNIFIENMNKLSLYERPMHCTDKKRETIYIKSTIEGTKQSQWEKDENNDKLATAIRKVSRKQLINVKQWTDEHPDFMEDDHLQKQYTKLLSACANDVDNDKITKRLCDKVFLSEKAK